MSFTLRSPIYLVLGLLVVAACRNEKVEEPELLFFGECSIEVETKTAGSEIFMDGVELGENHVKTDASCGEREIRIEKHGFESYVAYIPLRKGEPINITAELKAAHSQEIPAFSEQIIAKAVASTSEKIAKLKVSPAGGAAAAAPIANDVPRDQWGAVDSWR